MKNFLFVLLLFSYFFGYGQYEGGEQWNKNIELEWADFQGSVQSRSHHHALTASGISIDMKNIDENFIGITVQANFFPKQSWIKNGRESDHLLNHEQRHFDIAEIYRRKLIKKIMNSDKIKTPQIGEEVDRLYKANDKELVNFQLQYDKETKHSQIEEKQKVWDQKIDRELKALAKYDKEIIKISVESIMNGSKSKSSKTTRRKKSSKKRRKG